MSIVGVALNASKQRVESRVESLGPAPGRSTHPNDRSRVALVVAAAGALIVITNRWGEWLIAHGHWMFVNAPPLTGRVLVRITPLAIPAVVFAALVVWRAPLLADELTWRRLIVVAMLAAAAWAILLAATDGVEGVLRGPSSPRDYLENVADVGSSPAAFISTYVERIGTFAVKGRSHPPGMILLLWGMSRLGLGGPAWEAVLEIAVGASAVPAVLIAVRELAGESRARAAAPFVAIAPGAIWIATSGDALFAGVGAWAVAAVVLATGRRDRRGDALAFGGGVLFGALMFLAYGPVLLWAIPVVVSTRRRRLRPLLVATIGPAALVASFAAAGLWWPAGLAATNHQYRIGAAAHRPYPYFVVANLAAFAIAIGPAAWAGLAVLRERGTRWLVAGAFMAVAIADLSGKSKAEVERIWLPFAIWVLVATVALPAGSRRAWLAATVVMAIVVQLVVLTPW